VTKPLLAVLLLGCTNALDGLKRCSTAAPPVSLCPVSGSGFTPSPPSCFLPAKDVERGLEVATESRLIGGITAFQQYQDESGWGGSKQHE
jgi:hypothetical protein